MGPPNLASRGGVQLARCGMDLPHSSYPPGPQLAPPLSRGTLSGSPSQWATPWPEKPPPLQGLSWALADQGSSAPSASPSSLEGDPSILRGQGHVPTGTRHGHPWISYPGVSAHFLPPVHLRPDLAPGRTGSSALLSLESQARETALWRWSHSLRGRTTGRARGVCGHSSSSSRRDPAPTPARASGAAQSLLAVPPLGALRRWAEAGAAAAAAREGEGGHK